MHQVAFNQEINTSFLVCSSTVSNAFSKVCALRLYTDFPYNLDLCTTTSMASELYFFSSSEKSDLVTKTTGENVTLCVKMRTKTRSGVFFYSPAVVLPLKPGNPGHDHTEQQQRHTHTQKKNLNTAHSESTQVLNRFSFHTKSIKK